MRISHRASRVTSSGIRRMFDLGARLENPLDLSIGQPHFPVPEPVQEAAIAAIRAGHNRYTVTQGIPALNEAVLDRVEQRTGVRCDSSLITSGVAGGLVLSMLALTDAEDQALMPDPYFVCYRNIALMLGQPAAWYDTYPDFRITEERLEAAMTDKVKVLVLNSPGNPTGRVISDEELKATAAFAKRHDLPVITDEIYEAFTYDGAVPSILSHYDQVILLGGFGKTYGMPGWRLGYATGPTEAIERMRTLQQFSFVCAPTPLQYGALAALEVDMTPYIDDYRRKRNMVVDILGDALDLETPGGAFYAFPKTPGGLSSEKFSELAVERNLLIVPGTAFSERDTHFRLSFALPDDKLETGLKVLRELSLEAQGQAQSGEAS